MIALNLYKRYKNGASQFELDLQLNIPEGKITAISGSSGAGKTSLLRLIAGLEKADKGVLNVNEVAWFDHQKKINLKPQERKVSMVFQEPALFPNMTVLENLKFTSNKDLSKIIELTDIEELKDRNINGLSGGQKQRAALARAIAQRPELLLLDEPLSALDPSTRYQLQQTLIKVHREMGLTTLLVTHDRSEILRVADHMISIEHGQSTHEGKPADLLTRNQISGKFQFQGELVALRPQGILTLATVLVENQLIEVVIDPHEAKTLAVGDLVVIASKAFNPIIQKLS